MAAAVIPVVAAAAPLLMPLIQSLVTHVEHLFGAKTGADKFALVLQSTIAAADKLSAAGKIPGTLDPASIATMIQTLVSQLNANGVLTPENAANAVSKGSVIQTSPGISVPLGSVTTLSIVGGSLQLSASPKS